MKLAFAVLAISVTAMVLSSCTHVYHPDICQWVDDLPVTPASGELTVVFEDPGTIKVMHGEGCATLNHGWIIKAEQSVGIPGYANKATVFLNGWKVGYTDSDHAVADIATLIGKIKLDRAKLNLTWNAVGIFADDNYGQPISWCYHYTVVAWNDANLHALVDQGDADNFCKSGGTPNNSDNFFFANNDGATTALACFPSLFFDPNFTSGRSVAVLPRGFGFSWPLGWPLGDDHHLLQVAYNLEQSETFIQRQAYKKTGGEVNPLPSPTPTGRVDSGFVSWNTYTIFKDNDKRRDYRFGELVSAMGGSDVGLIQPPFSILPKEGSAGGTQAGGLLTQDVVVDNIPFAYAIPMLTGWEVGYLTDDQNVKEIGIWIDDIHYDKQPNAPTGTLRYKLFSILHDNDNLPANYYRHKVTILGLRPTSGAR